MHPIHVRGARTHNLKGVDLDIEPGTVVAITGPSGAGKSSLALDTLYAEGQRRFVESFSPYARQFLERRERPPVTSLDPVAATIAVDRRAPVKSSRSTLATLADLEAYLAALFGSEAVPVCPDCRLAAVATTAHDAAAELLAKHDGKRAIVSYAVRAADGDAFLELRDALLKDGYRRLVVGGQVRDIDEVRPSDAARPGVRVEVVVDRVELKKRDVRRVQAALEQAWDRGDGRAELRIDRAATPEEGSAHVPVGRGLRCPRCARAFEAPSPRLFSYNSPLGACGACRGFGRVITVDWNKVIPDHEKSLAKGAIKAWNGKSSEWERKTLLEWAKRKKIPTDAPWRALTAAQKELVLAGEGAWEGGKFPGVRAWFKWLETRTYKMHVRVFLARYRDYVPCDECGGARLNKNALIYQVGGRDLGAWHRMSVARAREALGDVTPRSPQGRRVARELEARLRYLDKVGLAYLSLDRQARTLSGGEAQRAGLTTALGAELTGSLFVLDEPTVGLHAADVPPLAAAVSDLARSGNAVLVLEHDARMIMAADRAVEFGPGAGRLGGSIVFDGAPEALFADPKTPTGRAHRRPLEDASDTGARITATPTAFLTVTGIAENNLAGIDVQIPEGRLVAITGPSGSGKSTLAEDVLYRAVARKAGAAVAAPGAFETLESTTKFARAVLVDQAPLGRTARGNAATYTKAWDRLRGRFAVEPEARRRALGPSHFSFNVSGGRCEACSGEGYETIEMQFLADVSLLCPVCKGKRFSPEVLAVKHDGLDVAEILELTVEEAIERFAEGKFYDPVLKRALTPVREVGLGYLPLGQPLSTLSGGEAQRLKLARALSEEPERTFFVVDEPSAGLHPEDARHVIGALRTLVRRGATVVVVEHDLDVILAADWVIDLGPGGGPDGGRVVCEGTPERVAKSDTKTGIALAEHLERRALAAGTKSRARKAPKAPAPRVLSPSARAITVEHAREHNLKDVSCSLPHEKLVVLTGPSGSGKSSLAFDVIYAEGQRRFMETLTPYARQFLPTPARPDVDAVRGVPPSIALEQRLSRAGANSTVATVTEIAHYLRLLYAKLGEMHCPKCGDVVSPASADELFDRVRGERGRFTLYSPAVRARKGTYLDVFTQASRAGVTTARVDGAIIAIDPPPRLVKAKEHTIDLIVAFGDLAKLDRAVFDRALVWGNGALRLAPNEPTAIPSDKERLVSTARACLRCGTGVPELDPRWFSFNTRQGQCPACEGTGVQGGPAAIQAREDGAKLATCKQCAGDRLAPVPRKVKLFGETYGAFMARSVSSALVAARTFAFHGDAKTIAKAPHAELLRRLRFVESVGLGYLGLGRHAQTLSGGEMQRLRLSAQLGAGLTGALYVLDEPTIGLHPRDTSRLLGNLRALVDTGSTVVVVEHDAETIRAADWVLDLGPTGGRGGGTIVAQGPGHEVLANPDSPTGVALREGARIPRPKRPIADAWLELKGAKENNLKNVTLRVPVGRLSVVCGVSGSGKSTLVSRVFYPALRRALGLVAPIPGEHDGLKGAAVVKRALAVDQSPIGRTPRSVPATFLGVWDEIRKVFANLPEARARGYTPARFSFNGGGGGRCAGCAGQGALVHEMSFLPDVVQPCEACGGLRFEPATLDIRYQGLSAGDVLHLSAEEAAHVFAAHRKIARPLSLLRDLGVGYLQIGQGSNTLSGGEAQRLKLAAELAEGLAHEPTVYILDEPTTGLHLGDVKRLLGVLEALVARGDTLVVIEHHPDVIASADWVTELGPEAGELGGKIVFEGPPAKLRAAKTATGKVLAAELGGPRPSSGPAIT